MATVYLSGRPLRPIVIAGGGTGGHIYPALAIAEELKQRGEKVIFVGSTRGLEAKIIPSHGYELVLLPIGPLNMPGLGKIKSLLLLPVAIFLAIFHYIRLRPRLVLGVGGYASWPFVWFASFFTRSAIWEPNAYPGLANRKLARKVDFVYVVFDRAMKVLGGKNCKKVGLPVRESITSANLSRAEKAEGKFNIFVFGGSQGAMALNDVVSKMLLEQKNQLAEIQVVHQVGARDFSRMERRYAAELPQVQCFAYIDDMAKYYAWADLVICRAGVSSIAELAAAGKPAILVPLPSAADNHQQRNAEVVAEAGAGIMLLQAELGPEKLWKQINDLLDHHDQLEVMSQSMTQFHVKNAAQTIVDSLLELSR